MLMLAATPMLNDPTTAIQPTAIRARDTDMESSLATAGGQVLGRHGGQA